MKTLFVGNRGSVLREMLSVTEVVGIGVMQGTFLENDPVLEGKTYTSISSYQDLQKFVDGHPSNIVVSNGLPLIIRTSDFPGRRFVNIHPSFLPDLRGMDPVLGAILFSRDAGATCHEIDDGIDTGPIISRVRIPYSADLNSSLLYQLSFRAEAMAFQVAWERGFEIAHLQESLKDSVNFSRSSDTRVLPFSQGCDAVLKVIRAFDNRNQGGRFFIGLEEFSTHSGWVSQNPFLYRLFGAHVDCEILMTFEDTLLIKFQGAFLLLSEIDGIRSELVGRQINGR